MYYSIYPAYIKHTQQSLLVGYLYCSHNTCAYKL